jgi:glycosyltransferase involved in cell wall biosynthesis
MSLWFVTPAFSHLALSAVCFDQRKQVIAQLVKQGIETYCVVIADDDNLELARERGFLTVEQNNDWLGRKFNDGIEYAGKHGAEWIVPIGSDDFIDPAYLFPLPPPHVTRTSSCYAAVTPDRMAILSVGQPRMAGPRMFHRSLLAPVGFRPAQDRLMKYIDTSTINGIGRPIEWRSRDLHPYQYIGFRGKPHITSYDKLWKAWGVEEKTNPWELLAQHYDPALVGRARAAMQ